MMAADPNGGYWTVTGAGAVTPHGAAPALGSPALSNLRLAQPIVGMTATTDGNGYWLVASDGGIFSYGDATFYGSTGGIHLNKPIVGMAATNDGTATGWWPPTAASSATATPRSTVPPARSCSTSPSSAWR